MILENNAPVSGKRRQGYENGVDRRKAAEVHFQFG
jgi:hypothetical protein